MPVRQRLDARGGQCWPAVVGARRRRCVAGLALIRVLAAPSNLLQSCGRCRRNGDEGDLGLQPGETTCAIVIVLGEMGPTVACYPCVPPT